MSASPPSAVPRVVAADLRATLAHLMNSPLIAAGRLQVIGLESVRARLGAAWPERRARVYDRIEAQAARLLAPDDLLIRLGEVDYLLVASATEPAAAQGAALRLLRDVLIFFFGAAELSDMVVKVVTALGPDGVSARPLSAAQMAGAIAAETQPSGPHSALAPARSIIRTPFAPNLCIDHLAAPLIDLRGGTQVGAAVWRRVIDERTGVELAPEEAYHLHASAIEAIDVAAATYGVGMVQTAAGVGRSLIVVPLSLNTLGSARGRRALLEAVQASRGAAAARVIVEITDLARGFLPSRVREAVSVIGPNCRAVFAQIPPVRSAAEQLDGCGLRGASFLAADLAQAARRDPDPQRLTEAAALVGPGLMICGLRTARAVEMAKVVGASLAVLDPGHAAAVLGRDVGRSPSPAA